MKAMDRFGNMFFLQVSTILFNIFVKHLLCYAAPTDSPLALEKLALVDLKFSNGLIETNLVTNLTRQHDGDVFTATGIRNCNLDTCIGLSSGTASTVTGSEKDNVCNCHCLPYLTTYREDRGICVDDIHECSVSPFVSGSSSEKIPFVFLPLRGQIIYPSREISFPDIKTPICAVTGSQYLTSTGWADLRNPIDSDFPFRMFRDEGRTFLQWLGEADLRYKMEGRLILIHLMCRDMSLPANQSSSNDKPFNKLPKNIFSPCVAFRVNGSPVKYLYNVSEVLFQPETSSNLTLSEGLSTKEYIVIGICSLLLGLIYVASVFLYLHVKKRKNTSTDPRDVLDDLENDINYPKNDQVAYGTPFTRTGSSFSIASINDHRNSLRSGNVRNLNSPPNEEIGIIKNNPLLKHFPNLGEQSVFNSELSNSNSECEDGHMNNIGDRIRNNETYAIIHPTSNTKQDIELNCILESPPSPTQENECLPEENVSIIEDMGVDEKLEAMRALISGTVRKKLYFNPTYFEPQLLISPPPAAIEFLTKIREVIAIAKYKMASKRYQPSLIMIPEESLLCTLERDNKDNSNTSIKNRIACTINCQDFLNNSLNKCGNCGDKHNSIQKWLETVPTHEFKSTLTQYINKSNLQGTLDQKGDCKEVEINVPNENDSTHNINIVNNNIQKKILHKTKTPSIPATAPKILSHSLKKNTKIIDSNYNTTPTTASEVKILTKFSSVAKSNDAKNQSFVENSSSSSNSSRVSKNKIEILDQHIKSKNIHDYEHYELLCNMKQMPDMVYEALAKDYSMGMYSAQKSNCQSLNIPTPDYDRTFDKKSKDIYNSTHGSVLSIPTPDYSTLGKNTLKQFQPDSPIYRRKSPQYLIVDYETDSLERTTTNRKCSNSSSHSSNNSSDLSSQPSPSLSTALPLEEEVEIRHTVYDKVEGFRKDGDTNVKKNVPQTNEYEDIKTCINKKIAPPRIIYDTPFRGSMTIEVQHEPITDKESTDSDQFEPDTLDRKPKKHSFCDIKYATAWAEHLKKSKNFVNSIDDKVSYSSLENMTSLPDFSSETQNPLVLRSSSSFRSNIETNNKSEIFKTPSENDNLGLRPSFGSLREIYQSKAQRTTQRPKLNTINFTQQGPILTLEAKHSKRQRKNPDNKLPKVMPPDVVPSKNDFYDISKCPQQHKILIRKNLMGWNTDDFNRLTNKNNSKEDTENTDSQSNHSQSTEVTGVSDTQPNSEFVDDNKKKSEDNHNYNRNSYASVMGKDYGNIFSKREQNSLTTEIKRDYSFKKYINRKKDCDLENYDIKRAINNEKSNESYRYPSLEVAYKEGRNSSKKDLPEKSCIHNIQTVYRVEVSSPRNGMQIALGLRDRAKKSKDFKNAWAKFLNLATSRFGSKFDSNKILYSPKDDGISSLIDSKLQMSTNEINGISETPETAKNIKLGELPHTFKTSWIPAYYDNRLGYRQELDSGYMSTESSEVYNRLYYEQYIDKLMAENSENITTDTLEKNKKAIEEITSNNLVTTECDNKDVNNGQTLYKIISEVDKPIKSSTYSSDDDETCNGSGFYLTESDEEGENTEDMSESGAESIETHSVLFRNIKNYDSTRS